MSKKKIVYVKIIEGVRLTPIKEVQARDNAIDNNNNAGKWPQTQSIVPLIDEHRRIGKENYNKHTDDM